MSEDTISRRTVLQGTSASVVGGVALSGHVSAADAGPCESAMPDLTVYNATDEQRWVSLQVDDTNSANVSIQTSERVGGKDWVEVESLGDSVSSHRLEASVDDGSQVSQSIAALATRRFMHGYRLTITEDDTYIELEHIDLPGDRLAELMERC